MNRSLTPKNLSSIRENKSYATFKDCPPQKQPHQKWKYSRTHYNTVSKFYSNLIILIFFSEQATFPSNQFCQKKGLPGPFRSGFSANCKMRAECMSSAGQFFSYKIQIFDELCLVYAAS